MANPVLSANTSFGFKKEGTPGTRESFAANQQFVDLVSENLNDDPQILEMDSGIGDRQKRANMRVFTHNACGGSIVFRPRYSYIDNFLELIFQGTSGDYNVPCADGTDLDMFTFELNKSSVQDIVGVGCKIDYATFRSEQNGALEIEAGIVAKSGLTDPGDLTAPDYDAWKAGTPFLHNLITFDATDEAWLGGASGAELRAIEMTLSNNLDADAFCNSQDRSIIPVGLFTLEGSLEIPYNSTTYGYLAEWQASTKFQFTTTWDDSSGNALEMVVTAELTGETPGISGGDTHKWLNIAFTGVVDDTDTACVKAKYTAAV